MKTKTHLRLLQLFARSVIWLFTSLILVLTFLARCFIHLSSWIEILKARFGGELEKKPSSPARGGLGRQAREPRAVSGVSSPVGSSEVVVLKAQLQTARLKITALEKRLSEFEKLSRGVPGPR